MTYFFFYQIKVHSRKTIIDIYQYIILTALYLILDILHRTQRGWQILPVTSVKHLMKQNPIS